jgi:hypothetical protein
MTSSELFQALRSFLSRLNPFRSLQGATHQASSPLAGSSSITRRVVVVIVSVLAVVAVYWVVEKLIILVLARGYVDSIADAWGINQNLANALSWVVFAGMVLVAAYAFSFSRKKRWIGIGGILALLILQPFAVWLATRDKPFDRSGNAVKCYVVTRDSIATATDQESIRRQVVSAGL